MFDIYSFSAINRLKNIHFIDFFRWNFEGQNVLIPPNHILPAHTKSIFTTSHHLVPNLWICEYHIHCLEDVFRHQSMIKKFC